MGASIGNMVGIKGYKLQLLPSQHIARERFQQVLAHPGLKMVLLALRALLGIIIGGWHGRSGCNYHNYSR